MATKSRHDWTKLDPLIDNLKAQGWNDTQISRDLGIGRQTLVDHLRSREAGTPTGHSDTPEHQGTLEGHQEVMEDVVQSVPEAPHIGTEEFYPGTPEHQGVPEPLDTPETADLSTPEDTHSSRVHPSTPTEEDWLLWTTMKDRWTEIEKMLADWRTRQPLVSTPLGTPRQTQKKTYVFDVQHIAMIDEYARVHRLELKDVIYAMCQEFFKRRANS